MPAEYDISLVEGWNLVSLPLRPVDPAIEEVLSSIDGNYNSVWAWNDGWLIYNPPAQTSLEYIYEHMGFWIDMKIADTLTVTGNISNRTTIHMNKWNLIGYPYPTPLQRDFAIELVDGTHNIIWEYDDGDWDFYSPDVPGYVNDLDDFNSGFGYWVNATYYKTWIFGDVFGEYRYAISEAYDGQPLESLYHSFNISVKSYVDATCKYDFTEKIYDNMINTFEETGGQTHISYLTSMDNGTYTIYVRCLDSSNEIKDTGSYSWTLLVNYTVPVVTLINPVDNENITGNYSLNATTDVATNSVEFYYYDHLIFDWVFIGRNNTVGTDFGYNWQTNISPVNITNTTVMAIANGNFSINDSAINIEVDNIPPAGVWDLDLERYKNFPDMVRLNWTAVGDDDMQGTVSGFVIRYSTSPINNEADFEAATEPHPLDTNCDSAIIKPPYNVQSCEVWDLDYNTTYYFAVKSYDNVNLTGPFINNASIKTYYFDVGVTTMSYSWEGIGNHTIYKYDVINFTANVTNFGEEDENGVEVKLDYWFDENIEKKYIDLAPGETKTVVFEYNVTRMYPDSDFRIYAESTYDDGNVFNDFMAIFNVPMWSIVDEMELVWYSTDEFPIPESVGNEVAGEDFYVVANLTNNAPRTFYEVPVEIEINDSFSIVDKSSGLIICDPEDKKCVFDKVLSGGWTDYPWWAVGGLPAGSYEVTVKTGRYPEDQLSINRYIIVI